MIVNVIDVRALATLESENDSPVCPYRDRPKAAQVALERMQSESRKIQIGDLVGGVEPSQDIAQFLDVLTVDASGIVAFMQPAQSLMPKRDNHA
jgi:hypothetical protein